MLRLNRAESGGARSAWVAAWAVILALVLGATALAAEPADLSTASAPIASDPPVRTGVLPNGLRFVILQHAARRHEVSLRLRIGAGSLQEPADQDGVAHMLEHMAFRGSTHVAESEIWRTLARLGVAFGADSNAFTTPSQTYFQFDLPDADAAAVTTGLTLMREIAGALTLSPSAVNDERNVVLAEARLTDSPSAQADRAQMAFWFQNQPAAQHDAMGDVEVLKQLRPDQLRAFYDAYYRPERATVLVVGDVDPDATEAQIRARFSDWTSRGPAGADPVIVPPAADAPHSQLLVQSGAPSSIRLAWIRPAQAGADSRATDRDRLLNELAVRVLNRRLTGQDGRYLLANADWRSHPGLGEATLLTIDCPPGQWRDALQSVEQARRQVLRYGVTQGEVEREAGEALHAWQIAAAAADSAPASVIANALVTRIDNNLALTDPAQDLAAAAAVYDRVDAAQVDAAMQGLFRGAGPLVFLSSPQPVAGGPEALALAVDTIEAAPISPRIHIPRAAGAAWPYTY